jgi:hypothetical protein
LEPNVQVVEQGLDWTDIEDTESGPSSGQHPGEHREERSFRFPPGSRSDNDQVLPGKNRRDDGLLEWTQFPPSQAVDDVMLQCGM